MKLCRNLPASAALVALACTHIVNVPTECGPGPQPMGHSAIGWERIKGPSRVSGRVSSPSLAPIEAATIGLTRLSVLPLQERVTTSNARGEFSFDSTDGDRYLLRVRRLGYARVADTLQLSADSGIVVTALLAQHKLILDDCGLTYTEKRVPWWKR